MNHLEIYQFEKHVPIGERDWVAWADIVEHHIGHSLDGDQDADGYSLDRAYSWFLTGARPQEYAFAILKMPQYKVH